jgi:hypothetical protein
MKEITKIVGEVFNIEYKNIFLKSNKRHIVTARQVAMYIIALQTKHSLAHIGSFFERDHATVLHAKKTISNLKETDKEFRIKVNIAIHKCNNINHKKIVYIAHPISGDVEGNVSKILEIIKSINLLNPNIIPFAPYIADVLALNDSIPEQREKGIQNNLFVLESGCVNELWVYGTEITEGVKREIEIATKHDIEVVFKN